jgi:O-acetyl-ADP-ribose deacetylase (regulator of RNase III)
MSETRLEIFSGDITTLDVDAIVNAANEALAPGGGVCGAIHRAAGPQLAAACARIGPCPTGKARLTEGYELPARYVIHAVGPVWHGGGQGEAEKLAGCYRSAIQLAAEHGMASIAFPAISTGIFGYPLEEATRIAVATVRAAVTDAPSLERVVFCTFGDDVTAAYARALAD